MLNRYDVKTYTDILTEKGLVKKLSADDSTLSAVVGCLTFDNREVVPNAIFVCKGAHFKEEYLRSAVEKGAVLYVSETEYDVDCPAVIVRDIRRAMSYLAKVFYNDSPSKIKSVGITGTKGKSTTAYYVRSILEAYSPEKTAVLSSIENYDGVIKEESHLTTPEAIPLFRHFSNAYESGLESLVMEVSSQALKYDRVFGIRFDVACFTNVGTDHISPIEHPDFEDYFASKLKIFDSCRVACVNSGMDHADRVIKEAAEKSEKLIKFGYKETDDIYCPYRRRENGHTVFGVRTPDWEKEMSIAMPGMFNVDNALAAIAVCFALGVSPEAMAKGLENAAVAGRMEVFRSDDGRIVAVVDYAHNEMSFEALFRYAESDYPSYRRFVVFGCPGKKAFLRRHDLGTIAGKKCDISFITEEDAGEEPVSVISAEIAKYVTEAGGNARIIDDRGDAIRSALLENGKDIVVFITGKGRETRQKRGVLYIDTPSDTDYVTKCIAEYNASLSAVNI